MQAQYPRTGYDDTDGLRGSQADEETVALRGVACRLVALAALFATAETVDPYNQTLRKSTEWRTHSYGLKTLAQHLGFEWRDSSLSGAASIEWFHQWTETGDEEIRLRILEYNEDDCRATRVPRDALEGMTVAAPSPLA